MANHSGILQDGSGNNLLPTPNSYATKIETGNTATQAYVKGAPVLRNVPGGDANKNGLFRAKTAIASGATFTVGTNIEKVNVGDLANQLWANGNAFYLDYQNSKYGFNTSASRGADTFVPFSGSPSSSDVVANFSNAVSTENEKIYTASQAGYIIGNFSVKSRYMTEATGGTITLYNSSGTKKQDILVRSYSAPSVVTEINIVLEVAEGDYIAGHGFTSQTTTGDATAYGYGFMMK